MKQSATLPCARAGAGTHDTQMHLLLSRTRRMTESNSTDQGRESFTAAGHSASPLKRGPTAAFDPSSSHAGASTAHVSAGLLCEGTHRLVRWIPAVVEAHHAAEKVVPRRKGLPWLPVSLNECNHYLPVAHSAHPVTGRPCAGEPGHRGHTAHARFSRGHV